MACVAVAAEGLSSPAAATLNSRATPADEACRRKGGQEGLIAPSILPPP
jgi:hypothetical protein